MSTQRHRPHLHHKSGLPRAQGGMALIEALVASAVLGIGLLGATQLTLQSLHLARENRQHTEAQHLAQEAMDCLRRSAALCPSEDVVAHQGVLYTRQSQSTFQGDAWSRDLRVRVSWTEGSAKLVNPAAPPRQQLEWHSRVSALPDWVGVSSP
jgi:type IV pilus modification protein PilV